LESTEGNLNRLNDLIAEIRRQLKPLGRQAEVARKAAVIQAEVRDAKARLLADDLVQATLAMESDLADERAMQERRRALEESLEAAREAEVAAEESVREGLPRLTSAQETWYSRAAPKERVASTLQIARERTRNAEADPGEVRPTRDPDELEREADAVSEQEAELTAQLEEKSEALELASERRAELEEAHRQEETRFAGLIRAAADRREGLARLSGQVNSLRSRAEAAEAEIGRLTAAQQEAAERAAAAERAFTALESKVAGLDDGEEGLDAEHELAQAELEKVEAEITELRRAETQ